jgi:hypothetical protein
MRWILSRLRGARKLYLPVLLALTLSACSSLPGSGVEIGGGGRPQPALVRVTLLRVVF